MGLLNPILSVVTLTMCRNVWLVSFHCSYLKQYTSFMPGVKKKVKRMCGLLWQYKKLYSELGRNLQEIKFHTELSAAASKQTTNSNSSQTAPTARMNSSLNWSGNCQVRSQEKCINSSNVQRHLGRDVNTGSRYALQTDGSLDISATAQVAIIITVLFLDYTTKEVLTVLPLQRRTGI
jgi:hypothetical protein